MAQLVGAILAAQSSETTTPETNDNGTSREVLNVNDNGKIQQKLRRSSREIDNIADQLVEIFANEGSRRFYCKVAMNLSEAAIWNNVELAKRGRSPSRYFTWLCKQLMG